MKAVILAAGLGNHISEETSLRPTPMVEIGGLPVLWHILKMYSQHGIFDFIICLGYKGYVSRYTATPPSPGMSAWLTPESGQGTAGHVKRVGQYLQGEKTFCMTYGDGVSNVNIASKYDWVRFVYG